MAREKMKTIKSTLVLATVALTLLLCCCNDWKRMDNYLEGHREGDSIILTGYEDLPDYYSDIYYKSVVAENNRRLQNARRKVKNNEDLSYTDCIALHSQKLNNSQRSAYCRNYIAEKYIFTDDDHQYILYIASNVVPNNYRKTASGYMSVVHSPKCSCQENSNQLP